MYTLMKADVLAQLAGLQQEISQLHDNAQQNQSHFVLLERRFSRLQSLMTSHSYKITGCSWSTMMRW